ncbi:Sterol uptake control protein [Paramyrothecium foliicola]|nr:Sterol uptake control protein [Paramyrothecium foliicola]
MPRQPRGVVSRDSNLAKTRRSHRKSRNGCSECKRRHIRCDEGRPACTNCSIAERACSYPPTAAPAAAASASAPVSASASASASPAQARTQPPGSGPGPAPAILDLRHRDQTHHHNLRSHPAGARSPSPARERAIPAPPDSSRHAHSPVVGTPSEHPSEPSHLATGLSLPPHPTPSLVGGAYLYTPQHLGLLLHTQTDVAKTIATSPGQGDELVSLALRYAVNAPYLMDELLAVSAMHLALTGSQPSSPWPPTPSDAASYRYQATELQTRALASFTRETESLVAAGNDTTVPNASPTTVSRFLFSAMLAIHVLADCLACDPVADFHAFIDGFVDCILLHHGVRITIRPNWLALINTELRGFLSPALLDPRGPDGEDVPGAECAPLQSLLQSSDLSTASIEACTGAVETLQKSFDMQSRQKNPAAPNSCSAFAVTVSADFVNVLRKHRPEALIILAYYGVLLHRSRACWIFAGSGARLIRAISQHLGGFWQDALRWPLEVIETEVDR